MPAEAPLVSVGMPVHNGAASLDRALTLIRALDWPNLEILISDNASDDDSPSIYRRHAAEDDRITCVRTDPVVDPPESFDRVLRRARGQYFMWAAHDDRWPPDHLRRLVPLLEAGAALAAGIPVDLHRDGTLVTRHSGVAGLAGGELADRILRFVAADERDGKGNLIYGLFRRATLLAIDPLPFWRSDARFLDHHLVLAALCHGPLAIDPELDFGVEVKPAPALGRSVRSWWPATREAWGWLDGYVAVADRFAPDLDAGFRAELDHLVAARRRRLLVSRGRRLVSAPAERVAAAARRLTR